MKYILQSSYSIWDENGTYILGVFDTEAEAKAERKGWLDIIDTIKKTRFLTDIDRRKIDSIHLSIDTDEVSHAAAFHKMLANISKYSLRKEDVKFESFTYAGNLTRNMAEIEAMVSAIHMPTGKKVEVKGGVSRFHNRERAIQELITEVCFPLNKNNES
mgnify:CR=1 FL=1